MRSRELSSHVDARRQDLIRELLDRLERLETEMASSKGLSPRDVLCQPLRAVARVAIIDELSRIAREDWLSVYRHGNSIDAISLIG